MAINTPEAEKFLQYHSNPNVLGSNDLPLLKELILEYPYCQSLHFLEAQASKTTNYFDESLSKAAAFASSRETLYQFIHHADNFESEIVVLEESEEEIQVFEEIVVADEVAAPIVAEEIEEAPIEIEAEEVTTPEIQEEETEGFGNAFGVNLNNLIVSDENQEEDRQEEILTEENIAFEKVEDVEFVENQEEEKQEEILAEENIAFEKIDEHQEIETISEVEVSEEIIDEHQEINNEIENISVVEVETEEKIDEHQEIDREVETIPAIEVETEEEKIDEHQEIENISEVEASEENIDVHQEIDREVETIPAIEVETEEEKIDKHQEINSEIEAIPVVEDETNEENIDEHQEIDSEVEIEEEIIEEEAPIAQAETVVSERKSREELFFDSPVSSDFFAFAKSEKPKIEEKAVEPVEAKPQDDNLAQYHDETLPYSFLWWLNKTRKEHAANHQPYAKAKTNVVKKDNNSDTAHLNHQIAENIFHLRGVDEISQYRPSNLTVPFDFRRKEHHIIEKFIKEEPQIKHPAPNKIDTENKAKKSSEDSNEVVSETLAKIYVEQMLYHKALDVYKKLSLKYPEKSAYFASQIKYLELKVN